MSDSMWAQEYSKRKCCAIGNSLHVSNVENDFVSRANGEKDIISVNIYSHSGLQERMWTLKALQRRNHTKMMRKLSGCDHDMLGTGIV
jgi:hypothetical protein